MDAPTRLCRIAIAQKFILPFVFAHALWGCGQTILRMGSPYDRYDHNRTRRVVIAGAEAGPAIHIGEEAYRPTGSSLFPELRNDSGFPATDRVPVGNLVPIFNGIALPLSGAAVAGGRSDREDVIDFLAVGPNAQAGVEAPDTQGDPGAAEACYRPVLDLLSSEKGLSGEKKGVEEWASCCQVEFADVVVDARYRTRAFAEVVAFRYRRFWFVLYRLPNMAAFTRLVVLPVKITKQDFEEKTLSGGC